MRHLRNEAIEHRHFPRLDATCNPKPNPTGFDHQAAFPRTTIFPERHIVAKAMCKLLPMMRPKERGRKTKEWTASSSYRRYTAAKKNDESWGWEASGSCLYASGLQGFRCAHIITSRYIAAVSIVHEGRTEKYMADSGESGSIEDHNTNMAIRSSGLGGFI